MSLLRFYIDEDSAERSLISAFRNSGLDVVTVLDVGRQSLSDPEQLIWATEQNRVIYSYNQRDFRHLLHSTRQMPDISCLDSFNREAFD